MIKLIAGLWSGITAMIAAIFAIAGRKAGTVTAGLATFTAQNLGLGVFPVVVRGKLNGRCRRNIGDRAVVRRRGNVRDGPTGIDRVLVGSRISLIVVGRLNLLRERVAARWIRADGLSDGIPELVFVEKILTVFSRFLDLRSRFRARRSIRRIALERFPLGRVGRIRNEDGNVFVRAGRPFDFGRVVFGQDACVVIHGVAGRARR